MIPSAAMHHTFATLFFVQPIGCCVFASMWFIDGSGHMYCPIRKDVPQSISTATISYNSFNKIKKIIPNLIVPDRNRLYLSLSISIFFDKKTFFFFVYPTLFSKAFSNNFDSIFFLCMQSPIFWLFYLEFFFKRNFKFYSQSFSIVFLFSSYYVVTNVKRH